MSADCVKVDPDAIYDIVSSLKKMIDEYKNEISKLTNLVNEINGSSAWRDAQVKTSFIATCKSYINIYQQLATRMENHVNYLNGKMNSWQACESAFAAGR